MIGRIARCKKCNNRFKIEELIYSPKPLEVETIKTVYKASYLFAIALFGIAALLFIGNFHIISGSDKGLSIVRRNSFSFSEFFINADRVTGMPSVSARTQFPISFKVLQREGIIKSDEASIRRIDENKKKEFDKALRDAQQEIDKMMQDFKKDRKNNG